MIVIYRWRDGVMRAVASCETEVNARNLAQQHFADPAVEKVQAIGQHGKRVVLLTRAVE